MFLSAFVYLYVCVLTNQDEYLDGRGHAVRCTGGSGEDVMRLRAV
jgi:hypothetical protein